MDTVIRLNLHTLSPGMAASALSLATLMLSGAGKIEPGPALDSVISDLQDLRNMIMAAQEGN